MKGFENDRFLADLGKIPWHTTYIFDNIDDICEHWYQLFIDVVDQQIPYKRKYIRGDQLPWITPEISSAIHHTSSSFQTASNHLWSINYKRDELVRFMHRSTRNFNIPPPPPPPPAQTTGILTFDEWIV